MPKFSSIRRVNLTVDQAFAIAADVGSYKDFLPLVKRSSIRGDRKSVGNVVSFDADLQIAFEKLNLRETFSSHVKTDAGTKKVTAISRDGPIKTLKAVWTIIAAPDGGCDVSIAVDYTMKSMMLQLVVGKLTNFAAQKIMTAFEERGRALYGARSS